MAQKQSQVDVKSTNFLSIFGSLLEVACQYLIQEELVPSYYERHPFHLFNPKKVAGMENSDESGTAMMLSCREETTPLLTQPDKVYIFFYNSTQSSDLNLGSMSCPFHEVHIIFVINNFSQQNIWYVYSNIR
uniref:Uncharacterized protein n=1 Tax=Cucumis melo TaxID=3656 RepID=A0A9I9EJA1_CUCME